LFARTIELSRILSSKSSISNEPEGVVGTKSSKSWVGLAEVYQNKAKDWAEKDTAPDLDIATSKSSKSWAGESQTARDDSRKWTESKDEPDDGSKSSKSWRD